MAVDGLSIRMLKVVVLVRTRMVGRSEMDADHQTEVDHAMVSLSLEVGLACFHA